MSTNLEESPLSDSKMDISDTTNSLESTGVSPVEHPNNQNRNDIKTQQIHNISPLIASILLPDDDSLGGDENASVDHANGCILNENEAIPQKGSIDHVTDVKFAFTQLRSTLDNRFVEINCRPEVLSLPDKHVSSLTLANSHPLMSPTGTDSDSENSCLVRGETKHKFNNFPDVIPNRERQLIDPVQLQGNDVGLAKQHVVVSSLVSTKNNLNSAKVVRSSPGLQNHKFHKLCRNSEAEVSQYQAAVDANFQSVALIPNSNNTCTTNTHSRQRKQANTDIAVEEVTTTTVAAATAGGSDDISSLDSISNHSFDDDEDIEHNLASLSPSSSLIDGLDDDDDDDEDCEGPEVEDDFGEGGSTPTNMKHSHSLPQYSAEDERRDSRNWQKITLPDGKTREIDMKVIEPYKRVLSHGGYLKAGGHNAIVIFCACHLPDRSRADYNYVMDNLFLYVVKTLEQLVTEDYVLIYLHGGTSRRNVPSFPWMKKCYQLLDRRLRKSLKNMYLVHPTFWIKSIVWMARPFVSTKFWRKLIYVKSLEELDTHVAVEKAAIPDKVKQYDAKYN